MSVGPLRWVLVHLWHRAAIDTWCVWSWLRNIESDGKMRKRGGKWKANYWNHHLKFFRYLIRPTPVNALPVIDPHLWYFLICVLQFGPHIAMFKHSTQKQNRKVLFLLRRKRSGPLHSGPKPPKEQRGRRKVSRISDVFSQMRSLKINSSCVFFWQQQAFIFT